MTILFLISMHSNFEHILLTWMQVQKKLQLKRKEIGYFFKV
jgi:hypothetical protein